MIVIYICIKQDICILDSKYEFYHVILKGGLCFLILRRTTFRRSLVDLMIKSFFCL